MYQILAVDDQEDIIKSLSDTLPDCRISGAITILEALNLFQSRNYDLVLIDLILNEESGLTLLSEIMKTENPPPCIMMSGYGSLQDAVESIKLGAYDFIEKPLSLQKLKISIKNAVNQNRLKLRLRQEQKRYDLIGNSTTTQKLKEQIQLASQSNLPVLIQGSSGSGKEHVAHLIHLNSTRNKIVKLNCAAIPADLFESELFGVQKGAFTGATRDRTGKILEANGGTLFLDEIGELPLAQQAKLLRVLEDHEITPLGGNKKYHSDFRLICATNRTLEHSVKNGNFREDLFYRLNVIPIRIPDLKEHPEDIPDMAIRFLHEVAATEGGEQKELSSNALKWLSSQEWYGNIRELKNTMQRAYVFTKKNVIHKEDLEQLIGKQTSGLQNTLFDQAMPLTEARRFFEKLYIQKQLALHNNNISRTAAALSLLPNNLTRRIKQLGIK